MITRYFVLLFLLATSSILRAQTSKLINSGEVISEAVVLYDSGKYAEAIDLFRTVPKQDTNYLYMLSELALTLNAAKEYEQSIQVCLEGLEKPSEFRAHLLGILGTAYDHKGELEKSIETYQTGLKDYPLDYLLHYNLGITYYNSKDYQKAETSFVNALRLNPYHTSSHLNLGRLSAFQGNKVRAMMCFGVYLSLANADNERLVFLEKLLNNEIKEESTFPFSGSNSFEKLDQIIRARVVNEKSFTSKIPVNAMTVKQFEMLLDQLQLADAQPDDFWIEYYLPLYKSIHDQELVEPFIYYILSSTKIEAVHKWKKKNEKSLNKFYAVANEWLSSNRKLLYVPESWKMENPVPAWYADGKLEAIGKKDARENKIGTWKYFFKNGQVQAEGEYDQSGEKTGTWKYYYSTGVARSIEVVSDKSVEVNLYTEEGKPKNHFFIKNDKVEGDVEIFYPCGEVLEKVVYKNGLREGDGTLLYRSGKVEATYTYSNDLLTGDYKIFYQDGSIKEHAIYKEGKLHGASRSYWPSGKLKISGNYDDGQMEGEWLYYFENGRLEKRAEYSKGEFNGIWVFYDHRGRLDEERSYKDGEIHGKSTLYSGGIKFCVNGYEDGKLVGVTYFDRDGNEFAKAGNATGTFPVKGYYPEGQLFFEGNYVDGKEQGDWTYYFREGMQKSEYHFENGKLQGPHKEYYKNGQVKFEQAYEDGEVHGYSKEYYIHGGIKQEGWYQHGFAEQTWISYYADGTIETENYFINGYLYGATNDYNVDGKIFSTHFYEDSDLKGLEFYDQTGSKTLSVPLISKTETVDTRYTNGTKNLSLDFDCDQLQKVTRRWPNGKIQYEIFYELGKRNGPYKYYNMDGDMEVTSNYSEGQLMGNWTWKFADGSLSQVGYYLNGKRDSVWTNYDYEGWVESRIEYLDGERDGISTTYNPDGSILFEKMYNAGNLISYRLLTMGKLGEWKKFEGNETILATFVNGKTGYEATYKNGLLHGVATTYYPSGQVMHRASYDQGDSEGAAIYYFENGKIKEKGNYKLDERDGTFEYYNKNGLLIREEECKMGVQQGVSNVRSANALVTFKYWAGEIVE